mgnify:CR=1 FL=1
MKITFDRDNLIKELSIAQEVIATKTALTILSNVLLIAKDGKLTMKATDVKVSFETSIAVNVIEEGSTTVFCDKLSGSRRIRPESREALMSRSLSSMTRLSHTQRRDNSLRDSLQGLALSVGGVGAGTHDEHDEIDERPGAGDEDTDDGNRQHQLDDALRGVAQVEVVNTEGAQEERQEHGDDPLLGSASSKGLTVRGLAVTGLLRSGHYVSCC